MLTKLYGSKYENGDKGGADEDDMNKIYDEMVQLNDQDESSQGNNEKPDVYAALTDPRYSMATWICISLAVFNQMSGINIINIYAATIFTNILETGGSMFVDIPTAGIFVGASGFVGAFISNFTVYFGSRRAVFIGGHFCMLVFLLTTAIGIHFSNGNISLLCICLFIISFQASNGAAFWCYTTEVGQDAAMGLCLFTLMGLLFIQSVFATQFVKLIGIEGFFYFFAVFQVFTCLFLWFFMKETKGLSSE